MKKKIFYRLSCVIAAILFLTGFFWLKIHYSSAEQSGSSPESGSDSRIKTAYDWLVAKGTNYGSTDAADWTNNWGTYWNRMMEAAAWEPDGDLAVGDVFSGKTFYAGNGDRTQKTGTLDMSLVEYDDYESGDSEAEESSWTNTATNVYKDGRTGLYWSNNRGNFTNVFPDQDHSSCDFFGESDRGDYAGGDADCGDAINACGTLSLDADGDASAETDWYLPTQKELQQAFIDGMYNQAGSTFTTTNDFWSSTERASTSTTAWRVRLDAGEAGNPAKTASRAVRCARRD